MTPYDHFPNASGDVLMACIAATGIADVGVSGSIDPGLERKLKAAIGRIQDVPPFSSSAMREMSGQPDAWILGELHNYYSAYHGIHWLNAWFRSIQKPLFLIIPDLEGDKCHRDFYASEEEVPSEWRQDLAPDSSSQGPGLPREMAFSSHEGGPRNGVLTALYDALEELVELGAELSWGRLPALGGFTVIFDNTANWAPALSAQLIRYSNGPLSKNSGARGSRFGIGRGQ